MFIVKMFLDSFKMRDEKFQEERRNDQEMMFNYLQERDQRHMKVMADILDELSDLSIIMAFHHAQMTDDNSGLDVIKHLREVRTASAPT